MALEVPTRLPVIHRPQNGGASPCSRRQRGRPRGGTVMCRWSAVMVVKGVTFLEEVFYG
jgi:hypothetical protein